MSKQQVKLVIPCVLFLQYGKSRKNILNLNNYRNAHYHQLNQAKKIYQRLIAPEMKKLGKFKRIKPCYSYYLPRKCDVGNVHAVVEKFFLDALVNGGKIKDDDCTQIVGAEYQFVEYDKSNPRCEVFIKELIKKGSQLRLS